MTEQEMTDLIEEQRKQIEALTLERDSLREENEKLIETETNTKQELTDTKKLNLALARRVDRMPTKSAEEILNEML